MLSVVTAERFASGMTFDEYVRYVAGRIKMARPTKVVIDAGNGVAGPVAVQTLRAIGCELAPGYLFARPMPADELARLVGQPPSGEKPR